MAARRYKSPLRAEQTQATRSRILAGAARLTLFDVERVTHAAVARSAGVSERTVYRHFKTVTALHEAFLSYQEQRFSRDEAQDFSLDELVPTYERWSKRVAGSIDDFVAEQPEPPFLIKSRRRRYARLARAIGEMLPNATATQRRQLVLVLGALVSPEVFRRAKVILHMNPEHVVPGTAWALRVLIDALRRGDTPWKRS